MLIFAFDPNVDEYMLSMLLFSDGCHEQVFRCDFIVLYISDI